MVLRRGFAAVVLACGVTALSAAAASAQTLFAAYAPLALEERALAPLVPIVLPAVLNNAGVVPTVLAGAEGGYSVSYDDRVPHHGDVASILLQGLGNRSVGGRREYFGSLYRYSKTRVRGQKALLLRARFSPVRSLVWREQGQLFELSTSTPRKIGVAALRTVAARLEHLRGALTAQAAGAEGSSVAVQALVADHASALAESWTAPCHRPSGEAAPALSGSQAFGWVRGGPGAFQSSWSSSLAGQPAWTAGLGGTLSAAGGQLTFSASLAEAAASCNVGPLPLTLVRLPAHAPTS